MMDSPRISVLIPVYRESETLNALLEDLLSDPYRNKEIIVVVDEPTPRMVDLSKRMKDAVKFYFNGTRKGKVKALNEAVNSSSGEILLFLDSDVTLNRDEEGFLRRIADEIRNVDILELKKGVLRDSIVARLVNYDYLGFSFVSWLFSRTLKKCLGFNGAAFAIKREAFKSLGGFRRVISEDLDMGLRSFLAGLQYKFLEDLEVSTRAPRSWSEWFKQRKRWGVGAAQWIKENLHDLSIIVRRYPKILLPSLLFIFPPLPLLLFALLIPEDLYIKAFYITLLLASTRASLLIPPVALTSASITLIRNMMLSFGSLTVYAMIFYAFSRRMGYPFNPLEFAVFYLIYSPLWFMIVVVSIVRVYAKPEWMNVDWKV